MVQRAARGRPLELVDCGGDAAATVGGIVARGGCDEILLSTPPEHHPHWHRHGLPTQIQELGIPVVVIPPDPTGWSAAHGFPDEWVRPRARPADLATGTTLTALATTRANSASAMVAWTSIAYFARWRQRHHVGGAERRRVREPEVQVVEEHRPPARSPISGLMCWVNAKSTGTAEAHARDRAAAVHQPVHRPRRRGCCRPRPARPKASSSSGSLAVALAGDEIVDEQRRRPQRGERRAGPRAPIVMPRSRRALGGGRTGRR